MASVDMEIQERQILVEENIDETLERLPKLLDKLTEPEPLMDLEEIDSQFDTNDLKTFGENSKAEKWRDRP